MKKIFVLLILSMLSTSLFAQTKKLHASGFALGETKALELKKQWDNRTYDYAESSKTYYYQYRGAPFIGDTWNLVRFTFLKNQGPLVKAEYIRVIPATSKETVVSALKTTNNEIRQRYGSSIISTNHLPWDPVKNNDDDKVWRTKDGTNWIETTYYYTGKGDDYALCITFYDIELYPEYKDKIKIEESSENDSRDDIIAEILNGETTDSAIMGFYDECGEQYEASTDIYTGFTIIEVQKRNLYGQVWDSIAYVCVEDILIGIVCTNVIHTKEMVITKLEETNRAIRKRYGDKIEEMDHLPGESTKEPNDTVWRKKDGSYWIETTYSYSGKGNDFILRMSYYDDMIFFE